MADYPLTSTWAEVDEAGQNRILYIKMDSESSAEDSSAVIYAALSAVPTRAVVLINTAGAMVLMTKPPANSTSTAEFIEPGENSYTKYVLSSTGTVMVTTHEYTGKFVVTISGSPLTSTKTPTEIAAAVAAGQVIECVTPSGRGWLGEYSNASALFNVIETGGGSPILTTYDVGASSVTENTFNLGGSSGTATKIYGFASIAEYRAFCTAHPTTIHVGDYVWVRGGSMTGPTHVLYIYDTDAASDNLAAIYRIDDTFLITITNSNGYASDKTYAQIVAAYEDGKTPVLLTEYGHRLPVTKYDSTASTPYIMFSGAVEQNGAFWVANYTITGSGVSVRGVMTDFVPVFLSVSNSVYDIANWPSFITSVADLVYSVQSGAQVCLVVPKNANTSYIHYPIESTSTAEVKFGGVEAGQNTVYTIGTGLAHVQRQTYGVPVPASGTAQSPSTDKDKVPTVDAYGNFVLQTPSSSGGSATPDVVYINLDLTNPAAPTITSVTDSNSQALSLSGLATKLASGPVRILSPVDQNGTAFEWDVCGQSSTQIAVYTNVPETTVRYLYTAFLTETNSVLGGTIYRQKIGTGNANDPTYSGNSNTTVSQSLAANTVYRFGYTAATDNTPESWSAVTSLTITNIPGNRAGIAVVKFLSGATPTVFTKPASLTMPDGFACEANTMYEISIMDGLACVQSWGWT